MGTAASSFLNPIVADPDDAGPKPAATALARRPDFGSLHAKPRLTAIVGTAMAFGLAGLFFFSALYTARARGRNRIANA